MNTEVSRLAMNVDQYDAEILHVVESVFETMLEMSVSDYRQVNLDRCWPLSALIHYVGEWTGAVVIQCEFPLAEQFTRQFLRNLIASEIYRDDMKDTLGELVNMVGGNLKAILPGGIQISAPVVSENANPLHFSRSFIRRSHLISIESGQMLISLVYFPNS